MRALTPVPSPEVAAREGRLFDLTVVKSFPVPSPAQPPASKVLTEEELFGPAVLDIVPPPYNLALLTEMGERGGDLADCVDVYCENIEGYGQAAVPRYTDVAVDPAEAVLGAAFIAGAPVGMTFSQLRHRTRYDLEMTGNAYWEVVRDLTGRPRSITHVPAYQMRLLREGREVVTATQLLVLRLPGGRVEIAPVPVAGRFRRFVQGQAESVTGLTGLSMTGRQRYFKQYGDPRDLNQDTGRYAEDGRPVPFDLRATEILHFRLYSARSPYGIPRWVGKTPDILGGRAAAEVNSATIDQNNIPSMLVTVDGGQLTSGSVARLEAFHRQVMSGERNWSTVLVLEGELATESEGLESNARVKIGIRPLNDVRVKDALFSDYRSECRAATRAAFRLPDLFFGGMEGGATKAAAETARRLTDEQVFAPKRAAFDEVVDGLFLELGLKTVTFRSATPNVTDNAELVAMLTAAERTGGVTPRIARQVVADIFPVAATAPAIDPAKLDPDQPYSLTMAVKVQNLGGAAGPAEVSQSVAPVMPPGDPGDVLKANDLDLVDRLMGVGDRAADELRMLMRRRDERGE